MENTLIIIDGNSIINRAFYALPDMSNSDGLKTNAIFGFVRMMFKIIEDYQPTHMSVAFDKKSPTFRHKQYADYKAGRKKMPDELGQQLEPLKELLDKFNINRLELAGYEADDIIGTVAKLGEENNFKVYIVTGDKDAIQLASHKTTTLITKKGVGEVEEYNYDSVVERYEMTPTQFIDLKGLMGDKSDNIPGVPGVGEKTGIKLLKQYSTIENLIEHTDELKGSIKKKIEENKELALMSKELATIITNVPLDIKLEDLEYGDYNKDDVIEKFKEFGFTSLISKLLEMDGGETSIKEEVNLKVQHLDNVEDFIEKAKENKKVIIDVIGREGNILDKKVINVFLSLDGEEIYYINEDELSKIESLLSDSEIKKHGYDLKEDYILLKPYEIELNAMDFDITIAEYLIDSKSSTSYECSAIAMKYLTRKIKSKEDLLGKGAKAKKFDEIDFDELSAYTADIINTIACVYPKMEEKLKETEMDGLFYHVEMPLVEVLGSMEYIGMKVDKDQLNELKEKFTTIINELENEIFELAGEPFNINSPKQLGVILFEKMNMPYKKKTKSGYSTAADVLDKLAPEYPFVKKILEYRQLAKLKSTYADGLAAYISEDGRIHGKFNQTITATGRISSTEPNLQNIPIRMELGRQIRKVFIPKEGCVFLDADYSQIELRIMAHMSKDEKLIEAYNMAEDIHRITASQVFGVPFDEVTDLQRRNAKAVNFGIIYGISSFGLSQDLSISRKEASDYIEQYFKTYPKIKGYIDSMVEDAKKTGYSLTMFNRRRPIPELKSSNFMQRSFGERVAMNAPIQGTAADIIKLAMIRVYDALKKGGYKSKLLLQIHDELLVETYPDEIEDVKKIIEDGMKNAVKLSVPLEIDMKQGNNWLEAH